MTRNTRPPGQTQMLVGKYESWARRPPCLRAPGHDGQHRTHAGRTW